MPIGEGGYPEKQSIWSGAVLGSIAHAIFVCRHPLFSNEQSWDGTNYNVQDSVGSRGTIAFEGAQAEKVVGVFFYEKSNRNPFHKKSKYDLARLLVGLPQDLRSLANDEALQYVLQKYNNTTLPIITSAFWADRMDERVTAAEPWSQVLEHGAVLIRNQLLPPDLALEKWASDYDLNPSEMALTKSLFRQKMAIRSESFVLDESDGDLWAKISKGQKGIESSRESFLEIGIILP